MVRFQRSELLEQIESALPSVRCLRTRAIQPHADVLDCLGTGEFSGETGGRPNDEYHVERVADLARRSVRQLEHIGCGRRQLVCLHDVHRCDIEHGGPNPDQIPELVPARLQDASGTVSPELSSVHAQRVHHGQRRIRRQPKDRVEADDRSAGGRPHELGSESV